MNKTFRFFLITGVVTVVSLMMLMVFGVYVTRKEGIFCAPGERVESTATNSKGMKAEIHICPDMFLSSYYYLETDPPGGLLERRVQFDSSPDLQWMDNQTLRIILKKDSPVFGRPSVYGGTHLKYEVRPN